jgi:hypothetical protein
MRALLRQSRPGARDAWDLVRGALDAHLHPQWPARGARARVVVAAALGTALAALASHAVAVLLGASDAIAVHPRVGAGVQVFPVGQSLAAGLLASAWLALAVLWRRAGSGLVVAFAALLALRFAADWLLLPIVIAFSARAGSGGAPGIVFGVLGIALWGGVAVLVLRRSRLAWPVALAAGCALELLIGSTGLSLATLVEQPLFAAPWPGRQWNWTFVPGYLEPLRIATWAAIMAALARGGRRRPWAEPPAGAPVSARPSPEPPEPVVARGRRAS